MMTLTIRLTADINQMLDRIAYETGIVKTALILCVLNKRLRLDPIILNQPTAFRGKETIRTTLRLPDPLKQKLEDAAQKSNLSINYFVNQALHEAIQAYQGSVEVNLYLPEMLYQKLLTLSKENSRSLSEEILLVLNLYCEKHLGEDNPKTESKDE
ncbi:hypothetical protein [Megasphaera sp.]|uniref:hypothetical protein n=1 Tax=Megasphaera sp. TaxID=2023260 RepID=UPI00352063AB